MCTYLHKQGIEKAAKVTNTSLNSFILSLESEGMAASTISRHIASMKAFFEYAQYKNWISQNPAKTIKPPRVEKKLPRILSEQEMEILLNQPGKDSAKSLRDKAMLELLCSTGLRVSELINLKVDDLNMDIDYITLLDKGRKRVISFNYRTKKALLDYLKNGRAELTHDNEVDYLFTNCFGKNMSRQGFWKLIKYYGRKSGIEFEITPHTFRHSFSAHIMQSEVYNQNSKLLAASMNSKNKRI